MKWFKHLTGSRIDPDICEAIERFGGDGYYVFFGTLEIMADEFDINSPGICQFRRSFLKKNLGLSWQKISRILSFFSEKERIFFEQNGEAITLNCPKLKDLCDDFTKKQLRSNSEVTPALEGEGDKEVEEELNNYQVVVVDMKQKILRLFPKLKDSYDFEGAKWVEYREKKGPVADLNLSLMNWMSNAAGRKNDGSKSSGHNEQSAAKGKRKRSMSGEGPSDID